MEEKELEENENRITNGQIAFTVIAFCITILLIFALGVSFCCSISRDQQEQLKALEELNLELRERIEEVSDAINNIEVTVVCAQPEPEKVEDTAVDETAPLDILEDSKTYTYFGSVYQNMYFAEDYKRLNLTMEPNYKLQQLCYTTEDGRRIYQDENNNEYYTVGLTRIFGEIGDAYEVFLDNGVIFNVIKGDDKGLDDPNITTYGHACVNYSGEYCINVIEFIADLQVAGKEIVDAGGYHRLKELGNLTEGGNIVKMVYLGTVWTP